MEFKFRAIDNRPTPTSYPSPLSTITYVSHRSLRAGVSSMVPIPSTFRRVPNLNNAGEAIRRELEKEQIRREIMEGEIGRRRVLEEEVRRELMLEREFGIAMRRNLAAEAEGFSFEERMAMRLNPRPRPPLAMMNVNPFHSPPVEEPVPFNIFPVPRPQQQLPQLMAAEIKPFPETKKDKVIILAKPDPDLYGAKRKAVTPPAVDGSEHSPFGLKKKPKEEWSCALCRVSATSERGLNEHLRGRKHKAKEEALRIQKIGKRTNTSLSLKKSEKSVKSTEAIVTTTSGLDAKADWQSLQPVITWGDMNQTMVDKGVVESKNEEQLVQKSQIIEDLRKKTGTASGQEVGRTNASKRRKIKFWCKICQVGTCSQIVMESHKNGKKHLTRMKKFGQNYGSAPPTSSAVSLEAPGLIKDTGAVNKETDQKITHVLNKETIIKMVESFADSDKVSPVAESSGDRAGEGL